MFFYFIPGGEFDSRVLTFTFRAGPSIETPRIVRGSTLPIDDSESESTEGFLLHVEIDEGSLDTRDTERVSIEDSVILVSILDDNGKSICLCSYRKMQI